MIRIKPNRCGYSNWSCQGIPQLSSFMFDKNNATVSALDAEIYKLPVKIKGMVYTEDTINMGWQRGGPHPEIPELTCRKDTDPDSDSQDPSVHKNYILVDINGGTYQYPVYGGTSGWLDLFNAGYDISGSTQYFYHDLPVPGSTAQAAAVTDVYLTVDGSTTRNQIYDIDNIPSFQRIEGTTVTELEMGPGLLEPMLDTSFDPIGIDTIPAWEAGDDSFIFEAAVLNAWKGVVDDRIRNIYARISDIHPGTDDTKLRDLKNEEYERSECTNFQISLHYGGDALRTYAEVSSGGLDINTYDISGGTVNAGGSQYVVAPLEGCTAPFYAYLAAVPDYTAKFSGQVLPDAVSSGAAYANGGTVTAITQPTTSDTNYYWTVTYPVRTSVSVAIQSAAVQPAPADGITGIGGVQVVSGGTKADDFVLFKIFQEKCVVSIGLPDEAGMVNHYYPSNLPPDGPEYSAGLVYPYDNIVSGVTGTDRLQWGHSAYVPTVNATYDFVHGESYGGDDYVAVDQALAKAFVTQGGTAAETYEVITTGGTPAEFLEPFRNQADAVPYSARAEVVNARAVYSAAESAYEDKYTSWVNAGSPTDPSDSSYIYYLQALEDYESAGSAYTSAYNAAYSEVIGGTPGTVYALKGIVWSDGLLVPDGKESITVPTAVAVYEFLHGPYALNDYGTVVRPSSGSAYVAHGTPGTVYTVDEVDRSIYLTGGTAYGYLYSEVPTVKAMVDYVAANAGSGTVVDAASGILTTSGGSEAFDANHAPIKGVVDVADNILVGTTRTLTKQAVPSVNAVYNFIHASSKDTAGASSYIQALATTAILTITYGGSLGNAESGETISGGTPGTIQVVSNVRLAIAPAYRSISTEAVPTVEGVYKFIHNSGHGNQPTDTIARALAEAGSMEEHVEGGTISEGEIIGGTVTGYTVFAGVPGTCFLTTNIPQIENSSDIQIVECAPTVKAVMDFVDGRISGIVKTGVVGTLTVSGNSESIVNIGDTTASEGYVWPIQNITMNATAEYRDYSAHTAVPTVEAVIKYMHSITTTGIGQDDAKANISASTVTTAGGSTAALATGATPGTFFVTGDITALGSTVTSWDGSQPVPTALAVANYVRGYTAFVGGFTVSASDAEGWITNRTATAGIYRVVDTLVAAATVSHRGLSISSVPTVAAVKDYVDTHAAPAVDAVKGTITVNASGAESLIPAEAMAGVVQPVTNIIKGTTATLTESPNDVPTVTAVWDFIHSTSRDASGSTACTQALGTPAAITLTAGVESWSGTPGTVQISTNITGGTESPNKVSPYAVPTVKAVKDYVDPLIIAASTAGTLYIPSGASTVAWNPAAVGGYVEVSTKVVVGTNTAITDQVVPSVSAVKDFVSGYTASVGTFTVPASGNEAWSTVSTAGIVQVVDTVQAASTHAARIISENSVPTTYAVKTYVDSHVSPSSYDGPFAVSYVTGSTTNVAIAAGNAHFAGKLYTYSGTANYPAGSTATTLYVQFVKGSTVGNIVESDTTGATVAAFPIARKAANAGGITQLQYGDINILGRWM